MSRQRPGCARHRHRAAARNVIDDRCVEGLTTRRTESAVAGTWCPSRDPRCTLRPAERKRESKHHGSASASFECTSPRRREGARLFEAPIGTQICEPRNAWTQLDRPGTLHRVIPIDELDTEPFGFGVYHEPIAGREAPEGVAAR